jgi:hypothetical protein
VVSRRVLLLIDLMCLAGVLWCAGLISSLLAGRALLETGTAVIVAIVLILPGFTAGVVTNRRALRGHHPQNATIPEVWSPPAELPRQTLVLAAVIFFAFWLCAVTAFMGLGDGAGVEQRAALGVLGAFGTGGTTLALSTVKRTRPPIRITRTVVR